MTMRFLCNCFLILLSGGDIPAQNTRADTSRPSYTNHASKNEKLRFQATLGKGVSLVAADSSMSINFSPRFQTLFIASKPLSNHSRTEKEMLIRRFRLKFDGFAFTPRLEYKIELALSNNDVGNSLPQNGNAPNIVLDAVLKYRLFKNLELWFGQAKLPGNRERLISSQDLQFVDRSRVNEFYNLDRDLGIQVHHQFTVGKAVIRDMYAVQLGQGRNSTVADTSGLSYTGRIEVLPFGEFTNQGDYFDADLEREPTPKLSIGAGYSFNNHAVRLNGELGEFVNESRDLATFFADVMIKYNGWSLTSEYMNKQSSDSPVLSDTSAFFQTGDGWNIQSGYLFKHNVEVAFRYTAINPAVELKALDQDDQLKEFTLGISKYFKGHSLKIQTDLSYIQDYEKTERDLRYRLQVELGF